MNWRGSFPNSRPTALSLPLPFIFESEKTLRTYITKLFSGSIGRAGRVPFLRSFLLVALIYIGGCATGPSTIELKLNKSPNLTPPSGKLAADVGLYYDPANAQYVHRQSISRDLAIVKIGEEDVKLFNIAVPRVFEKSQPVTEIPVSDSLKSLDGYVEPRLDYVSWRMFFDSQYEFFHVGYKLIFHTADGVPVSIWPIDGEGKYIYDQVPDVVEKFVNNFHAASETEDFRSYLASKRVAELPFQIDNVQINAEIVDENPFSLNLKAAGIIPVKVSIENRAQRSIKTSGLVAYLTYEGASRQAPAFPLAIVSEFEYLAATHASDPATAGAFLGTFGAMGSMLGSHSERV